MVMKSAGAVLALSLGWGVASAQTAPPESPPYTGLYAGAARVDITPADLTNLNPFGGGDFTGVHDPIYARALWLKSGGGNDGAEAAIVSLDLPEVGDMRAFLARIEKETGVPADHVMLIATHDHSAPRVGDVSPGTAAQKAGPESLRYSQGVYDKVIDAIRQAKAKAKPASFGAQRGYVDVNINRDVPDGKGGMTLGKDPHGASDKTVWVARFDAIGGKPIAILFNYAVHSTVSFGIKEISGDLGGAAARFVEDHAGQGVVALYTMAAAGDQAPRADRPAPLDGSKLTPAQDKALAWASMDAQGLMLGNEVLRVAAKPAAYTSNVRLLGLNRAVACPTKPGSGNMASMATVTSPSVTLRLSLLRLNDVAITGVGGEVVTAIYQRFMKEAPVPAVIFATNVNDRIGYIANDAAYDHPTFEVKGSPLARGCAEGAIVNGLTAMIRDAAK